jgi:large subunit ribosomal protein L32
MGLPKRRISRARGRKRRSANMRLVVPTLVECANCGNRGMRHRVCPKCGFYRGKQILKPEEMA